MNDGSTHRARLLPTRSATWLSVEPLSYTVFAKYVRTAQFRGVHARFSANRAHIARFHQVFTRRDVARSFARRQPHRRRVDEVESALNDASELENHVKPRDEGSKQAWKLSLEVS